MIRSFVLTTLAWIITSSTLVHAADLQLLFLGDQKSHQPATRFAILDPVMAQRGIELTYTENVDDLNLAKLNQYDGLVLYANIDTITREQADALLSYVASGKGFVPIHCATYCFRNSEEVVALMGAQFQRHGGGEMTTQPADVDHPITDGYQTFTSWDETYVHHKHNDTNRVVLEYRAGDMQADGNTREPWTWIRTHGKGRVFYTAWGHDERTWNQTAFHDLLTRGIRWACGEGELGIDVQTSPDQMPAMKSLAADRPAFEYIDVGNQIPNYPAGDKWGVQEKPLSRMQKPVPAKDSMQHMVTPEGFHVELFADESMLDGKMFGGKPIAMNWSADGRLWICETVDYPNELKDANQGRDRVRVLEDTDGDGVADKSTVFAEDLSIPTAIAFHRDGIVLQNGTETLYLKDTDGDGKADVRKVLISDWKLVDTHGGVSNFRNGLDNWIWAMQGYNDSAPVINGVKQPSFRMGFFRFKLSQDDSPEVEQLEFIRSTTNNTWGLGISEEGLIFGSTANRAPSFFMPIANRYYERVRGLSPDRLEMICPDHLFDPISDNVRQVDHHGGYTAGAGHAIYTARSYPSTWWNSTAFVCGPTGKLVGTFVIQRDGAGMKSNSPINLLASVDEWTAPIMAEVGPDGNVWVLDWYNYIVQHNPTPQGFETGKGQAYETELRDKKHGRIYRVVPDRSGQSDPVKLSRDSSAADLVAGLRNPTMQVRLSAQRLLVERGQTDVTPQLLSLIADPSVDAIGLNVAAIHALHTLHGLGELDSDEGDVFNAVVLDAVVQSLRHPSAGVRMNAVGVLPESPAALAAITDAGLMTDPDPQVVLASLLKMSDTPQAPAGPTISRAAIDPQTMNDRWLADAVTSAGAMHAESFLIAMLQSETPLPKSSVGPITKVAEHFARVQPSGDAVSRLVAAMAGRPSSITEPVITGLAAGWPSDHIVKLDADQSDALASVFRDSSNAGKATLARLATSWSNNTLDKEIAPIINAFIAQMKDANSTVDERLSAATGLLELNPTRSDSADAIVEQIGPQSPVALSLGLVDLLGRSKADSMTDRFLAITETATPEIREATLRVMLSRPEWTRGLLAAMESGEIAINDLTLEQRASLRSHRSRTIRDTAMKLFQKGGLVVSNDRSKLVDAKMTLTSQTGNVESGQAIFTKNCATCHVFKGEGKIVGPNLNGMSVHPKAELLTHILDPNRSVEANYRLYSVLTVDGVVINGLLSAESLTTIEMVDAQGKPHTILREDIEELRPSKKSAMPEGFEQSIDDAGLVDLLEYLTQAEQFVPLGLEQVANIDTTKGLFNNRNSKIERLVFDDWGIQIFDGVPFALLDPTNGDNGIMLHGPQGNFPPNMPKQVSVRCKASAKTIHLLGGVAGWAAKREASQGVSMIVRLQYADGTSEDHPLIDGQHIADYIGLFNVPQSKLAFRMADGGQVRYLAITPKRTEIIESIELVKPNHHTAPVVMAITIETNAKSH